MARKRLTKKQRQQIASIRAKKYRPAYENRLIRGVEKGRTRQQSRGHKSREHVARAEREREEQGLSSGELKSVHNFWRKFQGTGNKAEPTLYELVDWTIENGYTQFQDYRAEWDFLRKRWLKELKDHSYVSREMEMMFDKVRKTGVEDVTWLYYH